MNKLLLLVCRRFFAPQLLLLCLIFCSKEAFSQSNRLTWTGNGLDKNFSTAANWQPSRVPLSTDNIAIEVDEATTINVSNSITINSLTLNIKVVGNSKNTPNFKLAFNILSGGSLTVQSTINSNIAVANSTSNKDFEVDFNIDGTLNALGNVVMGSNGDKDSINIGGNGVFYFKGDANFGNHTLIEDNATLSYVFNGNTAQTLTVNNPETIPGIIVGDNTSTTELTISNPLRADNMVVSENAALYLNSNLTVNDSFLGASGSTTSISSNAIVSGVGFNLDEDATLIINASSGIDGNINTTQKSFSKEANYVFSGNAANTGVSFPDSVNQLTVQGVNLKLTNNLVVSEAIDMSSGTLSTLTLNENDLVLNGTYHAVNGVIAAGSSPATTSELEINGSGNLDNLVFEAGNNFLENLVIDRSLSGTDAISLNSDVQIAGALTLQNGNLTTGSNTINLLNTATLTENGGLVIGNIEASRVLGTSGTETFSGIGLEITPVVSSPGTVTVTRTTGSEVMSADETGFDAIYRIYDITTTALPGTYSANLAMTYYDGTTELNNISEGSLKLLSSTDGGLTWEILNSSVDETNNTITYSGATGLGKLTAGKGISPLPVSFVKFTATYKAEKVLLEWATASEINCAGFEIEITANNAAAYKSVGFVETKNGNSIRLQHYSFTDVPENASGTVYYRLKQVDKDGKMNYYGPVAVTFQEEFVLETWPNPFVDQLQISIESETDTKAEISVYNLSGQRVYQKNSQIAKGMNQVQLSQLQVLPKGIYMVITDLNNNLVSRKLVKQ